MSPSYVFTKQIFRSRGMLVKSWLCCKFVGGTRFCTVDVVRSLNSLSSSFRNSSICFNLLQFEFADHHAAPRLARADQCRVQSIPARSFAECVRNHPRPHARENPG